MRNNANPKPSNLQTLLSNMNNNKKSKQTFKAFTDKSIDKGLIGQKATIASISVSSHEQDTATRRTVPRVHVDSNTYYTNDQKEPWMELFQSADFEQLHSKIYDQVETLFVTTTTTIILLFENGKHSRATDKSMH
jgi:hypothetical protein